MAYDKTEPHDDDLGVSRGKLVNNFDAIETYIAKDHVSFDDNGANAGLHQQVTFEDEHTPAGAPGANQGIMYVESTEAILKFMNSTGTAQTITGWSVTAGSQGSMTLPGGIIVKWGNGAMTANPHGVTFGTQFPTVCYTAVVSNSGGSVSLGIYSKSKTAISIKSASGNVAYSYIVIGK